MTKSSVFTVDQLHFNVTKQCVKARQLSSFYISLKIAELQSLLEIQAPSKLKPDIRARQRCYCSHHRLRIKQRIDHKLG